MDFSSITLADLLQAAPIWEVQLVLILMQAAFWHLIIVWILPPFMLRFINSMKSKDRYLEVQFAAFRKLCKLGEHERHLLPGFIAYFNGVIVQHLTGGLLCLPSLLGLAPPGVASALACHAALAEVGWEIQDTLKRAKEFLLDGKLGRQMNPPKLVVPLLMHHVLAECLVLPMNMYYHDSKLYHEAIFMLQGVAVVSYVCQHFGYTCDVDDPRELLQLRAATTVALVVILWSRVVHSAYLWYVLLRMVYADGQFFLFKVALVPVVCMSLFNLMMVMDCCKKFSKLVLQKPPRDYLSEPEESTKEAEVKDAAVNPVLLRNLSSDAVAACEKKVL